MALFKTTAELAQYFPARLTLNIEDLLPSLEKVENDYLLEQVLGVDQYNELHDAFQAGGVLPARLQNLLDVCRIVSANLAIHEFADVGNLSLGSGGFIVSKSRDRESVASNNRIAQLKAQTLNNGYSGLSRLLGFLYVNWADYPLWVGIWQSDKLFDHIIPDSQTFNRYVRINNDKYLFWQMRSILNKMERSDGALQEVLCDQAIHGSLVTEAMNGTIGAPYNELVSFARPIIAHMVMAEAIHELSLMRDQRGIWKFSALVGGGYSGGPVPATDEQLKTYVKNHRDAADDWKTRMVARMRELAEEGSFPDYAATDCYTTWLEEKDNAERDTTSNVGNFL